MQGLLQFVVSSFKFILTPGLRGKLNVLTAQQVHAKPSTAAPELLGWDLKGNPLKSPGSPFLGADLYFQIPPTGKTSNCKGFVLLMHPEAFLLQ